MHCQYLTHFYSAHHNVKYLPFSFLCLWFCGTHILIYICNAFKCCNMKSFCTSVIHTIHWIYLLFTSVTSTHKSQWNLQRILLFTLSSTLVCSSYFEHKIDAYQIIYIIISAIRKYPVLCYQSPVV